MKATLECMECVLRQALRAARIATDDPALQRRIIDETARRLPTLNLDESPAAISLCAYELTAQLSGNPDPYQAAKRAQNAEALKLEPELRRLRDESHDPLETALHLAAAGNIIDLGTLEAAHIDVMGAVRQVLDERFAVDHMDAFRRSLDAAETSLFFLDNAGEIVFDKLLIEILQRYTHVTAVVKKGPVLNDALYEDADEVGLTAVCDVIDNGGAFIGSPLNLISPAFRARMDETDLIIGKGQGNYETLDDYPGDVFLILRAKCEIVADHMGVNMGRVGLISTRLRQTSATTC